MIDPVRYPAPEANQLFGANARIESMVRAANAWAVSARKAHGPVGGTGTPPEDERASDTPSWVPPSPTWLGHLESIHGHEVVGLLSDFEDQSNSKQDGWAKWLHLGLTSSDLTEYALFHSCWKHAKLMESGLDRLGGVLSDPRFEVERAGRTHGQPAATTNLAHVAEIYRGTALQLADEISNLTAPGVPIKSPGPVGYGSIAEVWSGKVAAELGGWVMRGRQICPRDILLSWANLYLRTSVLLADMATEVRFGSSRGELTEGAAFARVGSSAMPHKRNPIASERVCGLHRVVVGAHGALVDAAVSWEDRDLSGSSTERVSVPTLASAVEFMLNSTTKVWSELVIDGDVCQASALSPEALSFAKQTQIQLEDGVGPVEAGRRVREEISRRR